MCIYIREEEMITVKHVSGLLIWSLEVIVRFQLIVFKKKKKKENVEKKNLYAGLKFKFKICHP